MLLTVAVGSAAATSHEEADGGGVEEEATHTSPPNDTSNYSGPVMGFGLKGGAGALAAG
ncbi:hypothetical protein [Halolamina sp. C58]|uniref:hypothetical protein n=1 Tax=Halolamina sp. C58 TaxID=3421640 RepID=UPI003EBFD11E